MLAVVTAKLRRSARYDRPGDRLKREYIEEKALEHALFTRISSALRDLGPRPGNADTADRPGRRPHA
jgi:hypothetical protein